MMRQLNLNEMEMVSGGHLNGQGNSSLWDVNGGGGDVVVATATRIDAEGLAHDGLMSSFGRMTGEVTDQLITQGMYNPTSNLQNQLRDLQNQLAAAEARNAQQDALLEYLMGHDHAADTFLENFNDGLNGGTPGSHNPANPPTD